MNHFISIVFDKKPINEDIDIAVVAATSSANIGLLENEFEYEMYESENSSYVITIPTIKSLNENDAYKHAQQLADKLFDAGFENFDIEFSVLESQINEATLRRGSRGPEVVALQQQLGVTPDGIFGPQTEQALRAFQQRAGIQVDGIAGGQTQSALAAGGAPRNAGTVRPSTAPFQQGQGSTTQTPPAQNNLSTRSTPAAPTTAAPQTSPRPVARPAEPAQTAAPVQSPRPVARPAETPAATTTGQGLDDTAARAEISRQLQAQRAAADARRGTNAGPTTRGGPRGQTPAPAALQAQTTTPAQPAAPAAQGALAARVPGTDVAQQGRDVTRPTTPPTLGQPPAEGTPPAVDTTPPAAPVRQPQPQTVPSAARAAGQPGRAGMAGDETSALDAIAADRASGALPTPTRTAPRNAPADGPAAISGPGQAARPGVNAPQPAAEPAAEPVAEPVAPVATVDAPAAAQALSAAMRGLGTDEEGIASALQGIQSQEDWDAIKAAYNGDLLSDLASELNTRDYQRYVSSILQAAGVRESVPARPKGAFMFRERADWDEIFGNRYNRDGTPKARLPFFESRVVDEETYHGNDFYEAYGDMWYNEDEELDEAEYQGRKVKLGKPMRGDVKKFKVYVKNPKGNVVKVNFGDPDMKIKKSNPARRRSFRARHNCDNPGPRHKARYWSCRKW